MADERAASVAAVHAAADRARAYADSTGQPVPQATVDFLKSKLDALDQGPLDNLKSKIADLEKRVSKDKSYIGPERRFAHASVPVPEERRKATAPVVAQPSAEAAQPVKPTP